MWNFNQAVTIDGLTQFFATEGATARDFGNRVYQTFEALTFAQVIKWYQDHDWDCKVVNPGPKHQSEFRLKFSTRGDTKNFTYVKCTNRLNPKEVVQIRHQLRIEIFHNIRKRSTIHRANIVCDVAVLHDGNYNHIRGKMHVDNHKLITFVEAKHMDAYAELIASFIGLVHELQPWRLSHDRKKLRTRYAGHLKPCMNLSGILHTTAEAIKDTFVKRGFDLHICHSQSPLNKI